MFQQRIIGQYQISLGYGVNGRLTLHYVFVIYGGLRSNLAAILND
jgi:hypothetical protein